ncbi:MAG: TonB family protein [Acidobacteriaceae bacterium]
MDGAQQDAVRRPEDSPGGRSMRRWVGASAALHACVLGAFLFTRAPQLTPAERPGDASGHILSLTYAPGFSAPATQLQAEKAPPKKPVPASKLPSPVPAPPVVSAAVTPAPAHADAASGTDALGDADITIALVLQHPTPEPDLSQLPSGTSGDVIIDVVIDKDGRIAKSVLTRGLGHGVDQTVMATIQQWTFQPAKRNGVPVASEQELLFHYDHG